MHFLGVQKLKCKGDISHQHIISLQVFTWKIGALCHIKTLSQHTFILIERLLSMHVLEHKNHPAMLCPMHEGNVFYYETVNLVELKNQCF